MADHDHPSPFGKSSLITVSHVVEQAALASAEDGPMVVFAMFQRMPYFAREQHTYARIARLAAATVIGAVDPAPSPPQGCHLVPLDAGEALAREWTVLVLTPRFGAVLVAYDREEVDPEATTLESGRLFDGRWSFRRDDALHEAIRLRALLAERLTPAVRATVDRVLDRVRDLPSTPARHGWRPPYGSWSTRPNNDADGRGSCVAGSPPPAPQRPTRNRPPGSARRWCCAGGSGRRAPPPPAPCRWP